MKNVFTNNPYGADYLSLVDNIYFFKILFYIIIAVLAAFMLYYIPIKFKDDSSKKQKCLNVIVFVVFGSFIIFLPDLIRELPTLKDYDSGQYEATVHASISEYPVTVDSSEPISKVEKEFRRRNGDIVYMNPDLKFRVHTGICNKDGIWIFFSKPVVVKDSGESVNRYFLKHSNVSWSNFVVFEYRDDETVIDIGLDSLRY